MAKVAEIKKEIEWPVKITLTKPVMAHDKEISVLVFNEPNGGHLMDLPMEIESASEDGGKMKLPTVELASALSNVPPSTIKALSMKDAMAVMKLVNPLAVQCLETFGG
jgi:hypothetical protein